MQIKFHGCRVGRQIRSSAEHLLKTVCPDTAAFKSKNGQFRYEQYPSLPWAVAIYKAQGLSLDKAVMDLGHSVFAHGQACIALSRVKSLEQVMLVGLVESAFHKNGYAVH